MERIKCRACGCYSMVPMDVTLDDEEILEDEIDLEAESHFFTCHVCGDNWLSIREEEDESGGSRVTFVHQMGMSPTLKRVAYLEKNSVLNEDMVDKWEYYVDESETDEENWQSTLENRRRVLKSVCSN
jgi:hypothetical protein